MLRSRFIWLEYDKGDDGSKEKWVQRLTSLLPEEGKVEIITNDADRAEPILQAARARRIKAKPVLPAKGAKRRLLHICERNFIYRSESIRQKKT